MGQETLSSGRLVMDAEDPSSHHCQYMDPRYYMSYNPSAKVCELLSLSAGTNFKDIRMLNSAIEISKIPLQASVSSLLESERKHFEVLLALCKVAVNKTHILCVDEYFDKDLRPIIMKNAETIYSLCQSPEVQLQIFIVTHSRNVMQEFSSHIYVVHKGSLYSRGNCQSVNLPSQLETEMIT